MMSAGFTPTPARPHQGGGDNKHPRHPLLRGIWRRRDSRGFLYFFPRPLDGCADRRDGLRTFGDIVYTLNIGQRMAQVDLRDALSTEENLPESVLIGWPQGDGMSREGPWQLDVAPLEGDPSLLLDFAHQVVGGVGDRRQMLGQGARARLIAAGRGCHGDAFVGTHVVVDVAPALEGALTFLDVAEGSLAQHFGFEAGMEALVLAHGLGTQAARQSEKRGGSSST